MRPASGGLGSIFGRFGGSRGIPGEGFGHFWAPQGASWRGLWRCWAVLGASWVAGGRFRCLEVQQGGAPGQHFGPKRTQDGTQNGTQNAPKSKTKMKMKKDALEDRLGAILEPSWADLGPPRSPKSCSRPRRGSFFQS